VCAHCLEEKRVAFSCKNSFCLSCYKVYIDQWVAHIGQTLYEGVSSRHVVLTMPKALQLCFYRDRPLLANVMQCGVAMLQDALAGVKRCVLEAGYIVVLETAGRAGHWHPHLHILMTSGGVTSEQRWQEVDYFPFEVLHKKWQYYLLTMVKERVGTQEIRHTIDALWWRYRQGFVAYWEKGKVPAGGEGLAYLPGPIRREPADLAAADTPLRWPAGVLKDHKTRKREEEDIPAVVFIGRMVQHILPKGFHRIRYYGLHATCKAKKVRVILQHLLVALGRLIARTYRIVTRKSYREQVWVSTGGNPLRCRRCGQVMLLWQVWHPRYGVVYDKLKEIKRGRYGPRGVLSQGTSLAGKRPEPLVQLSLPCLQA
jgi:hypothetical protein